MKVDYVILADAATTAEGKQYIHGAGWDAIGASSFPLTHPQIAVAFRVRIPWSETNYQHRLEVDVVDADEQSILPTPPGPLRGTLAAGRPVQLPDGSDQTIPIVINLQGLLFPAPGAYAVKLRLDELDAARAPFLVSRIGAPATLPPG